MPNDSINVAASEWLARLDSGNVTAAQRAEFEAWRSADPRHAAAYARLSAAWQQLDRVQVLCPPSAHSADENLLLAHPVAREATQHAGQDGTVRSRLDARRRVALAAAVVLAIAVGLLMADQLRGSTYVTSKGGFERIVLRDQSVIELNTDSKMRVHFGRGLREIELIRGEASFEVAHDSHRPFVVAVGGTAVRAVGTRFNIRRREQSVEVVVNEGKVLVGPTDVVGRQDVAGALPIITAGHSAISGADGVQVHEISPAAVARKLAWQESMLVFEGDSLAEVIAEFNRYNDRQIVIADPNLASLKIGGYFRPTNLQAFLEVLERNFAVRVRADRERVTLASSSSQATEKN